MKKINSILFEEAQVGTVQRIHHPFSSQSTQLIVEGKKVLSKPPSHKQDGSFPQQAPQNCKLDVWIVIFFSPENQ